MDPLDTFGSLHLLRIHSLVVKWLPSKESSRVRFPLDAIRSFLKTSDCIINIAYSNLYLTHNEYSLIPVQHQEDFRIRSSEYVWEDEM